MLSVILYDSKGNEIGPGVIPPARAYPPVIVAKYGDMIVKCYRRRGESVGDRSDQYEEFVPVEVQRPQESTNAR